MKGCRDCEHASEYSDSVCHMAEVNKGARKIIAEVPEQLTSMLAWTVLAGVFMFVLMTATYLVLRIETNVADTSSAPVALTRTPPVASNVAVRELCSSKEQYAALEQLGYVDAGQRTSKLMNLRGVSAGDVHYVFADTETVPWLYVCSLESTLRAAGNNSRVNVFVVNGIENQNPAWQDAMQLLQRPDVSLLKGLFELNEVYGADRLNVVHAGLNECLDSSPLGDGVDVSHRPGLAVFAVQLAVLWQFGGTVLDAGVVTVRDRVYRADSAAAVEYGNRTASAPVACNAFIFDAMLCARNYAKHPERQTRPFGPETVENVWRATVVQTGRVGRNDQARPVPPWIVCRGVSDGPCYYVETDRGISSDDAYDGFCPVAVSRVSSTPVRRPVDTRRHSN